jgi:forkhead transcription factor HCM1
MVDSPFRRVSALLPDGDLAAQQTPGTHGDHLWYYLEESGHNNTGFDIFEDAQDFQSLFALTPSAAPTGSPAKRSVRKQRFERSQSTSALNQVANPGHSASKSTSFLRIPSQPNLVLETPSKAFDGLPSSPSKLFADLQSPSKMPLINGENLDVGNLDAGNLNVFHGISMGGLEAPDFMEDHDFSGFDMLAGFEKIGSSNSQASRGTTKAAPLNRSYTSTF